jgi:photosystem II stability/assembly factor-like uncharacterized protein
MTSSLLRALLAAMMLLPWQVGHPVGAQDTTAKRTSAKDVNKGPAPFESLEFRSIGPAAGGRITRVAGVAGDPATYYAATASGGVWKSVDGGMSWKPIFDEQPVASIGSIAVAPSDPNVVYVGSGEANIRGNVQPGNGIYRSLDAGKSWTHVWKQEGQIGTVVAHPTNPNIAFAAVLGHAFGPNPERGVLRTTDGGKTWRFVLQRNPDTGASDVALDPSNPNIVYAGFWQARRRPWELTSGGPGSGLWVSRDGGDSWKRLGKDDGLPGGIWGKVGVGVAPSDGLRVYALIEADSGGLFRSDDGGEHWRLANAHRALRQRPWYYTTLTVDPTNPDIIWFPQVPLLKSIDGGRTIVNVKGTHHGDHHDVWIDPRNPRRIIEGNDGGVDITVNGGDTWYAPPLPISQFYHVNVDGQVPYRVSGAMQDLGTASGPSNSLSRDGIRLADWFGVGGGEAGHTAHDPADPNIVYAGEYGGYISRYDHRTRQERNVSIYPENPSGHGGENLKYRFQWTSPILTSQHTSGLVYHAGNVLFRSTDGGQSWTAASPDLTRNDKSKQKWSGGPITGDNTGVEIYGTIFAIAESPKDKALLWAGSDDGLVHVSRDAGRSWTNVTKNVPGLPEWGTVATIEASPFDAGTAYLVVDAHRLDDMRPYLWKTSDYGRSWKRLGASLPQDVYLHAIREDPARRGMLYAGTDRGVAFSTDDGATWQSLKLGLPPVAVHDLRVKGNDLVLGTHGRSLWIFDDLTPIRTMAPAIRERDAHLFTPPPTIAWRWHSEDGVGPSPGANPPQGALVYYYLKRKPKDAIRLEIVDASGAVIRTLRSTAEPAEYAPDDPDDPTEPPEPALAADSGVQRAVWDLRHEGPRKLKPAKLDFGWPDFGPKALPGTYTLRLVVDGKTYTDRLVVEPDPRVKLAPEAAQEQLRFTLEVREQIDRATRLIEGLRAVRRQVTSRAEGWRAAAKGSDLVRASSSVVGKLDSLEGRIHNPRAQVVYDILAQPGGTKLYSRITPLYMWAVIGDGAPTQGVREVYTEQKQELDGYEAELQALVAGDVAALNRRARELDLGDIAIPAAGAR